jgi:LPXTG-site transpeptidase (sortase) family protein
MKLRGNRPLSIEPGPIALAPRVMDGAVSARNSLGARAIVLPPYDTQRTRPLPLPTPEVMNTAHTSKPDLHESNQPPVKRPQLRQSVQTSRTSKSRKRLLPVLLITLAVLVLVGGGYVFWLTLRTNQQAKSQLQQLSQSRSNTSGTTTTADIPDEKSITPKAYVAYTVAADLPRYLRIPKYGVKARIVRLGVLNDGELATPRSIWDVGWYDGSSKPGEVGAGLLAGHYSGPTQPGAFAKISQLVAGDSFTIERGDGTVFSYRVVKTETLPNSKVSMAGALVSVVPGKKGINLITCAGQYSPKTSNYSERTVVYAVQI